MQTNLPTPTQANLTILLLSLLLSLCTSCTSTSTGTSGATAEGAVKAKGELDRPTALALARQKIQEPVNLQINRDERDNLAAYARLIADQVITCQKFYPIVGDTQVYQYQRCQAGARGAGFVAQGPYLIIPLGYKRPSEVTGISRVDQNSALVDLVLSFEPADGYSLLNKYPNLFRLEPNSTRPEQKRVTFRLYDDGWRAIN